MQESVCPSLRLDTLWTKFYHIHFMWSLICNPVAGLYFYPQSKMPVDGSHFHFDSDLQKICGSCWGLACGVDMLVPATGAVSSWGHFQTCWAPRGWSPYPEVEVLQHDSWLVTGTQGSCWVGAPVATHKYPSKVWYVENLCRNSVQCVKLQVDGF